MRLSYEPRSGPFAARVAPPPPGAIIAARRSKSSPRRHDAALSAAGTLLGTPRQYHGNCRAFTAKGPLIWMAPNNLATTHLAKQKDPPRVDATRWILSCFY
jgi:hypothetical protein